MQFVIAIVLILFTFIIQKQVDFGSDSLGVNLENIVGIQMTDQLAKKKDVLKETLLSQASVDKVIFTQYYPGKKVSGWASELQLDGNKKDVKYHTFSADAGFFDIMGLKLLNGRIYKDEFETDTHKVIVNEQFLREYGINNPIGTIIPCGLNYEIIGVVKDFHFQAVNEPITPLVIRNDKYASIALIKLKTGNFNTLHDAFINIKRLASELSPAFPVRVTFFDNAVEQIYKSEVKFRKAFSLFAFCAIIICCMGILAMSIFTSQRCTKEIGVRKVNGAKTYEIISMLNRGFSKWIAIAFVIACPIAWYAMHKWLENFAYKTELSWWVFTLAGLIAMGIALLTVSFQSWRAATRNPVESLRYE
jgi:putative ABC transport system permease protein